MPGHSFKVDYATSVVVPVTLDAIEMSLDRIDASKYGDSGNQEAFEGYLEKLLINPVDGDATLVEGTHLEYENDSGGDIFKVTFSSLRTREERSAFLKIVRFLATTKSDDSKPTAEEVRQLASLAAGTSTLDKLVLQSPWITQVGDNHTVHFTPVLLANGASEDYPVSAAGLTAYELMLREVLYFYSGGAIDLPVFAGSGWITAVFDDPDTPTVYNVTFAADNDAKRAIVQQVGALSVAGIHNPYKQLVAAGAQLLS